MEINADLMWPRKSREEAGSVRIRRAGNVAEIALATHDAAHGGGGKVLHN